MIKASIQALEKFILANNKYFTTSFSDVSQSPYNGFIMSGEDPVFPNDTLGNYFYLRVPNYLQFDDSMQFLHAEGDVRVGLKMPMVLVACVREADDVALLENLITTLRQYMPDYIKFVNCTFQKEIVITQELARIPKEDIQEAIKKVDMDYAIVSITFLFTFPYLFQELNCIQTP